MSIKIEIFITHDGGTDCEKLVEKMWEQRKMRSTRPSEYSVFCVSCGREKKIKEVGPVSNSVAEPSPQAEAHPFVSEASAKGATAKRRGQKSSAEPALKDLA